MRALLWSLAGLALGGSGRPRPACTRCRRTAPPSWERIAPSPRSTRTRCRTSRTATASATTRSSAPIPGVDVWLPGAGKQLTLPGRRILPPGPREGIVLNLPEHRLYYFPEAAPGRAAGRDHLPGEHRQDGLAHPARRDARHRQDPQSRLVSARVDPQGARRERRPVAEGRRPRTRQSARRLRLAPRRRPRRVHDPRHQQPDRRRHGGHPRLHPHVSRGCRGAVCADSGRHASAPDQRAGEGRLGRRPAAARSASAGR